MWWRSLLNRSLRLRLTATLSCGLGLLLGIIFAGIDIFADKAIFGEVDTSLDKQARAILAILRSSSPESMRDPMNALMPEFRRDIRGDFFQIRAADGATVSKSDSCGSENLPEPPPFKSDGRQFFELRLPSGEFGRAAAVRETIDNLSPRYPQPVTVVVAEATENLDALETQAHWLLTCAWLLSLMLCSFLANIAVRRGLGPLDEIGARAAQLTASPHASLPNLNWGSVPAELSLVVRSLDAAFSRLLTAIERERYFARTVAHELRTPLAQLRSSADLALRLGAPDAIRQELDDIAATTDEMAHTLEALMNLARYEGGLAQPEPEPLDLRQLLEHLLCQHAPRADARGLTLQLTLPDTLWVCSHPSLLARILANLVQNAVDYSPIGSDVHIDATVLGNTVDLRVRNHAPGLSHHQIERLGEAHWRRDEKLDADQHGGLGIYLARAIANVLDLRLHFRLDESVLVAMLDGLQCVAAEATVSAPGMGRVPDGEHPVGGPRPWQ
jgi:two-component system sensor histidine kinase QseC